MPTVFTIHNLAYQGRYPAEDFAITGLDPARVTNVADPSGPNRTSLSVALATGPRRSIGQMVEAIDTQLAGIPDLEVNYELQETALQGVLGAQAAPLQLEVIGDDYTLQPDPLGLVEAAEPINAYVQTELGEGYWAIMQDYHSLVIRHGLRAPLPAPDFLVFPWQCCGRKCR